MATINRIMIKESLTPNDTLDALKKQVRKLRILKDGRKSTI
jgi:hypothetical protein